MVQKANARSIGEAPPRSRRADERRLEILRAAARVFRRQGYAATGMRDIAAEAGLSPGNLYHYFSGKHEILYFCQDRALDRMLAAVEQATRSRERVADRLRSVIRAHACCVLDELEGSAAHLEIDALPPELRREVVAKRDRYEAAIRRLLAAGVADGELRACDEVLVTRAILGSLNWTARWFSPEGPRTPEAVAEGLADYLTRGLEASPAPGAPEPPAARPSVCAGFPWSDRAPAGPPAVERSEPEKHR